MSNSRQIDTILPDALWHLLASYLDSDSYKQLIILIPTIFTEETLNEKKIKQIPNKLLINLANLYDIALIIAEDVQERRDFHLKLDMEKIIERMLNSSKLLTYSQIKDSAIPFIKLVSKQVTGDIRRNKNYFKDQKFSSVSGFFSSGYIFSKSINYNGHSTEHILQDAYNKAILENDDIYDNTPINEDKVKNKIFEILRRDWC